MLFDKLQHYREAQECCSRHFRNALLCKKHDHGQQQASCAVDALAEIYYHGVYPNDSQAKNMWGKHSDREAEADKLVRASH